MLFLLLSFLLKVSSSQVCLTSPPTLEWDIIDGEFYGNLAMEAATFFEDIISINVNINTNTNTEIPEFTTRTFNGTIPGPTIVMKRGETYHLTYTNNLGPEDPEEQYIPINTQKHPNTTNIHTHGLHISGESPSDNVFNELKSGESVTYEWKIHEEHNGGTSFYHPHVHGSTAIQTLGGAAGALIMEESQQEENLPDWLVDMDELIVVFQEINLRELDSYYAEFNNRGDLQDNDVDNLYSYDQTTQRSTNFYLVNGEYMPNICMDSDAWLRLKIVNVGVTDPKKFTIPGCQMYLLAKDGVWIRGDNNIVPRQINDGMWLTVASRAEISLYCPSKGSNITKYDILRDDRTIVAYIEVYGYDTIPTKPSTILTEFEPKRPSYLHNLLDTDIAAIDTHTISINAFSINKIRFSGIETDYLFNTTINTAIEFNIINGQRKNHAFHMHVNHMQLISGGYGEWDPADIPQNWTVYGDWLDTVEGQGIVRFNTSTWGGKVMMHCHILKHEDQGAMAQFQIKGGCDADQITNYDSTGNYPSCQSSTNEYSY